jgi:arylsulfatase A-like enzyme
MSRYASHRQHIRRAFVLVGLVAAVWGCRPGPAADVPPTWVWDQDQTLIASGAGFRRNSWNGWAIDGDAFLARETVSRMIFWSRAGRKAKLHVTYSLNGRPVNLIINKRHPLTLEPTLSPKPVEFDIVLNRGRNLLEFLIQARDWLRINRVSLDRADEPPRPHLLPGESVTLFLNAGRGRIEWRGSGGLTLEKRFSDAGRLKPDEASYKTNFLSRKIRHKIELTTPGILTVTADSGHFDLSRFVYEEKPKPPAPEPRRLLRGDPPIFILLADACQARHLSVYGYPRRTSPRIEEFTRDAVLFENAYANASFTRSSVRSLLTGLVPEKYGIDNLSRVAESRLPTVPEFLKIKGYRTSIFTSAVTISPTFGFTKGIDDYFQYLDVLEKTWDRKIDLDRFAGWLKNPGPLFSYVHFIEPHLPIVAPPPFLDMFAGPSSPKGVPREKRLISLLKSAAGRKRAYTPAEIQSIINDYDSTIAYVDSEIGKALDRIRKAGLYEESLIIVLADHGEAMSEHGAWGHSTNVFEETTHVPLIVKFPADMGLKGRVPKLVQITDIFPTLLELFGQAIALPGTSLLDAVRNPDFDDAMAVSQSISEIALFGMRWRRWYYITGLRFNRNRLYDMEVDPLKEAGPGFEDVRRYFEARFLSWLKTSDEGSGAAAAIDLKKMSPTEIENLKSLGYLKSP